jgi:hypothetical protein
MRALLSDNTTLLLVNMSSNTAITVLELRSASEASLAFWDTSTIARNTPWEEAGEGVVPPPPAPPPASRAARREPIADKKADDIRLES